MTEHLIILLIAHNLTFGMAYHNVEEDMGTCEQHREQLLLRMQVEATATQVVVAECIYARAYELKVEGM